MFRPTWPSSGVKTCLSGKLLLLLLLLLHVPRMRTHVYIVVSASSLLSWLLRCASLLECFLPIMPRSPNWYLPFRFSAIHFVGISYLPHLWYMPRSWYFLQLVVLMIFGEEYTLWDLRFEVVLALCCFLSLSSKYSPYHPFLEHFQSTSFPQDIIGLIIAIRDSRRNWEICNNNIHNSLVWFYGTRSFITWFLFWARWIQFIPPHPGVPT
jgi:hypothetical protein